MKRLVLLFLPHIKPDKRECWPIEPAERLRLLHCFGRSKPAH